MLFSITNGLDYLHTLIEGYSGKPKLAHCDLKSKNILVKKNLDCCIADLGLSLRAGKDDRVEHSNISNVRFGTKRYLAPEILNRTINVNFLNSFQKAEIYSLSLVAWELLRGTKFESQTTKITYSYEYKLPYFEYLQNIDPDEQQMYQLVCKQKARPSIIQFWHEHPIMSQIAKLCTELWYADEDPLARLSAFRIKKILTKISNENIVEQKQNNLITTT